MTEHSPILVILYDDKRWRPYDLDDKLEGAAHETLLYHAAHRHLKPQEFLPAYATLILSNDVNVADLNRLWRGKNQPTNVLSFPMDESYPLLESERRALGDIILAYETVLCESRTQGKIFHDHVIHLLVHGMLHLLGYDHEIDHDAEEMEDCERGILARLGIQDPYSSSVMGV
jgi:probable rRNA maturation factor